MLKKYLLRLKAHHRRAWREQKGQSLIIFVFAILGLIAMMGLALDLGLVYIERVRVSRTTDAAALASVVELPFEEEAIRRAIEFIELNGYKPGVDTEIKVRGCIVVNNDLKNVNETGELSGNATMTPQPPANRFNQGYSYPGVPTPPPEDKVATFVIDTLAYQSAFDLSDPPDGTIDSKNKEACDGSMANPQTALFGTANKLRVSGEVHVTMNFMRFFGWSEFPVSDEAVGENVTNLDVMVVFDVSGSMNYETNCFGCWSEGLPGIPNPKAMEYPFPTNGLASPLRVGGNKVPAWGKGSPAGDLSKAGDAVCSQPVSYVTSGPYKYSVHEAELYSGIGRGDNTYDSEPWRFGIREPGQGFWVLQRPVPGVAASNDAFMRPHSFVTYNTRDLVDVPQLQGGAYDAECWDPATNRLNGECWKVTGAGLTPPEFAPGTPPFIEYDFTVDWAPDSTHVWIRAIGGHDRSETWSGETKTNEDDWRKSLFFQVLVNGDPLVRTKIMGGDLDQLRSQRSQNLRYLEPGSRTGTPAGDTDRWTWVKINNETLNLPNGRHILRIYEGSTAFNLDKIVITNDPTGVFNVRQDSFLIGGALGPPATDGSATREACNVCNPMYGENITNGPNQCSCNLSSTDHAANGQPGLAEGAGLGCTAVIDPVNMVSNDLFRDDEPLRSAQEAVKNFAARLDPKFDQLGVVAFNNGIVDIVDLQCLRVEQIAGNQRACFDPSFVGPHPESVTLGFTGAITYARTIQAVENYIADGTTNISRAMREGLRELGISVGTTITHKCDGSADDACDRQGAARRVLILMTDGAPNTNVSGPCKNEIPWRGLVGGNTDPFDCSIYYAREAADNNVVVYTIGIGPGVDRTLLTAMAEGEVRPDESLPPCTNDQTSTNGHPCGDDGEYFPSRGGKFFPAARPTDLDAIFEQILDNIYVRIVG